MKKWFVVGLLTIAVAVWLFPTEVKAKKTLSHEEIYLYCTEIGEKYSVCPELLMALCERESSNDPNAVNGKCQGLCQVSVKWHKDRMARLGVDDLFDPYGNILVACDYLTELFDEYEDMAIVLGIYHGEKNVLERTENGEFSSYVNWVIERTMELEEQHGIDMETN